MKTLKKLLITILCILGFIAVCVVGYSLYYNIKPYSAAKKDLSEISTYAHQVNDLSIPEQVSVIGLGEGTHGNKEYQELKLDVLKTLVSDHGVTALGMEMDYGEGVVINQYIHGINTMSIDQVMDNISFGLYDTVQIQNLIEWMKEYNTLNPGNQLCFYGFDMQNPDKDMAVILDFINANQILEEFDIADSMTEFINGDFEFRSAEMSQLLNTLQLVQDELVNNPQVYSQLDNYDTAISCINIVFQAKELSDVGNNGIAYGNYRDIHMSQSVQQAAANEQLRGGRLMIAGHNGHIGYAGSYVKTMGAYLHEDLGDKYIAIGTDCFISTDNIKSDDGSRKNHKFYSCDILAYQCKNIGPYYLNFSEVPESSELYNYIHGPINTLSVGESFTVLNYILPQTVRIKCEPDRLFDGMIFIYEATPLELR